MLGRATAEVIRGSIEWRAASEWNAQEPTLRGHIALRGKLDWGQRVSRRTLGEGVILSHTIPLREQIHPDCIHVGTEGPGALKPRAGSQLVRFAEVLGRREDRTLTPAETRYRFPSATGLAGCVGRPIAPAGWNHTLCFDAEAGGVRGFRGEELGRISGHTEVGLRNTETGWYELGLLLTAIPETCAQHFLRLVIGTLMKGRFGGKLAPSGKGHPETTEPWAIGKGNNEQGRLEGISRTMAQLLRYATPGPRCPRAQDPTTGGAWWNW